MKIVCRKEFEEWRATVGIPGYEVSNLGRVRRITGLRGRPNNAVLRATLDAHGYPSVYPSVDGRRLARKVHRLVAEAFLGPKPTASHEVAHNDGVRTNPRASNLRWATRAENHADKLKHGTDNRGERHGMSKMTTAGVRWAMSQRKLGRTVKELATALGVNRETVGKALRGESWAWLKY